METDFHPAINSSSNGQTQMLSKECFEITGLWGSVGELPMDQRLWVLVIKALQMQNLSFCLEFILRLEFLFFIMLKSLRFYIDSNILDAISL